MVEKRPGSVVLDRATALIGESVEASRRALPFARQAFDELQTNIREEVRDGNYKGIRLMGGRDVIIEQLHRSDFDDENFDQFPIDRVLTDLWPFENLRIALVDRVTVTTKRVGYLTIDFSDEDVLLELKHFAAQKPTQLLANWGPIERAQAALEFLNFINGLVAQRRV